MKPSSCRKPQMQRVTESLSVTSAAVSEAWSRFYETISSATLEQILVHWSAFLPLNTWILLVIAKQIFKLLKVAWKLSGRNKDSQNANLTVLTLGAAVARGHLAVVDVDQRCHRRHTVQLFGRGREARGQFFNFVPRGKIRPPGCFLAPSERVWPPGVNFSP
jgi:hypothetical protein